MKLRTLTAALLAGCLGLSCLTGCAAAPAGNSDTRRIVCTNFAAFDWVTELTANCSENYEITYLLANGVDSHSYQPSAADIAQISSCDLFLYVGGESEQWAKDALATAVNKEMHTVCMLDCVTALEEETVEGMECEEEESDDGAPEYDEHVWLSLTNASHICNSITDELTAMDPDGELTYHENLSAYQEKLLALDDSYSTLFDAHKEPLIVADRFPFRYLTEDYHIPYYAAFAGCSAETEASFETIAFLAKKVDETGADTIFIIEGGNASLAEAVRDNTQSKDQHINSLNSMQSVTTDQIDQGFNYLDCMTLNLQALRTAYGEEGTQNG